MNKLILFSSSERDKLISKRAGETKFGEQIQFLTNTQPIYEQLLNLDVQYVIFGIPEDVGVFANHGKSGAYSSWGTLIKVLLNIQSNNFLDGSNVLILGHFDFTYEMAAVTSFDQTNTDDVEKARNIVSTIDKNVTQLVSDIVKSGKTPIIIGGGHNNAYGNIKGASLALNTKINVINLDAHTDFRQKEGRHSGNGFTYAFDEGYLDRYFIFGIHENYTSQNILEKLEERRDNITYNTFEDLFIKKTLKFKKELKRARKFIKNAPYGIEIDCDAIENIPSSAMTPSGFSVNKTRTFINYFAGHKNATYLHICEAAPVLGPKETASQVGKLLTYLVTDFIKANTTV